MCMRHFFDESVINSDNLAVKDDLGNELTYHRAWQEAQKLKSLFTDRSLVCVLCDYTFETVSFVLKMLMLCQPLLLLSSRVEQEFLMNVLEQYQPGWIWCRKERAVGGKLVSTDDKEHFLKKQAEVEYRIHPELALLLSTSGSSGSPKMVKLSYQGLWKNVVIGKDCYHITPDQRGILSLPLDHIQGLVFCLYHMVCGATVLVTEAPLISSQFADFYTAERANNITGVPFSYKMLRKVKFWDSEERLNRLNVAVTGGARLELEEYQWLVGKLGKRFWLTMGQTECGGLITAASFDNPTMKIGTVGKAVGHIKLLLDENKQMIVETESVSMGYAFHYSDLEKGYENGSSIASGDIAEIDEEGYVFLKGRISRFVKILGERISLDDLEKILEKEMVGFEFACTGGTDEINVYYADVITSEMEEQCRRLLLDKVHIPLSMIHLHQLRKLPRSSAGKIQYSKLALDGHVKN